MNDKIKYINIAVTNRCNLSCKHCDIWQEEPKENIIPDNIQNIVKSRMLDSSVNISLTGGEPFLCKNLTHLTGLILKARPGCLSAITTNGTLRNAMLDFLVRFKKYRQHFSFCISFDGVANHNKQRNDLLSMAINNAMLIKDKFPDLNVKLKFTITPINYGDIIPTYNYAKLNKLRLKIKLVENAGNYTNKIFSGNIFRFTEKMKSSIASDLSLIYNDLLGVDRRDAYFVKETIKFLLGKKAPIVCSVPFNRLFLMPDGKVYSCIHYDSIGNINDKNLEEIWHSKKAELVRSKVKKYGCNKCVSYHGFNIYSEAGKPSA